MVVLEKYLSTKELELESAMKTASALYYLSDYDPGKHFFVYFPRTGSSVSVSVVDTPTGTGFELVSSEVWMLRNGMVVEDEKSLMKELHTLSFVL
jgi:hypothetical protein